jgi:hypothetical protein
MTVPRVGIDGDSSFAFMGETPGAFAAALPHCHSRTPAGQRRVVDPVALVPVLRESCLGKNDGHPATGTATGGTSESPPVS